FTEPCLDIFRSSHHAWTGQRIGNMARQNRRKRVDHRAQQDIDLHFLAEEQFAVVAAHGLDRIATIDRSPSLRELAPLILRRVGAENNVLLPDTKSDEESDPELVSTPYVERLWQPYPD